MATINGLIRPDTNGRIIDFEYRRIESSRGLANHIQSYFRQRYQGSNPQYEWSSSHNDDDDGHTKRAYHFYEGGKSTSLAVLRVLPPIAIIGEKFPRSAFEWLSLAPPETIDRTRLSIDLLCYLHGKIEVTL